MTRYRVRVDNTRTNDTMYLTRHGVTFSEARTQWELVTHLPWRIVRIEEYNGD